jgi:hypothetical protein
VIGRRGSHPQRTNAGPPPYKKSKGQDRKKKISSQEITSSVKDGLTEYKRNLERKRWKRISCCRKYTNKIPSRHWAHCLSFQNCDDVRLVRSSGIFPLFSYFFSFSWGISVISFFHRWRLFTEQTDGLFLMCSPLARLTDPQPS